MSGVMIVGLNGVGKTTLGRLLSEAQGWFRIDVEDYYFLPGPNPYAVSRSKDEVRRLMLEDIRRHPMFVLSTVNGDWGDEILSCVKAVVFLHSPPDVRLERIDRRSAERFGERVIPGGDMYEQERRFRDLAAARTEQPIEDWLNSTGLPVLHLDAALPIGEVLNQVVRWTAAFTPHSALT